MSNPRPKISFSKNDNRASLAGKKSSRALPPELKELRTQKAKELELTIHKYSSMSLHELKAEYGNPEKPAIDLLVIKCLTKAIERGDFSWIEPMLARSIGKVKDEIEVTQKSFHAHIVATLEKAKKNEQE